MGGRSLPGVRKSCTEVTLSQAGCAGRRIGSAPACLGSTARSHLKNKQKATENHILISKYQQRKVVNPRSNLGACSPTNSE